MMRINRIVVILTVLGVLTPGLDEIGYSQSRASEGESGKSIVIAGSVGLPGVTMRGLPGEPVTDSRGAYSVEVPKGWAGSVQPMKQGYAFEPESRVYESINRDYKTEDYAAKILTFTISGNVGAAGVKMKGLPGDPTTDAEGRYAAQVEYGWSGEVTPEKTGYHFDPPSRTYSSIVRDLHSMDYMISVVTYTISGNVGLPGVAMKGLPGSVVTGPQGDYHTQVAHGWSGTVIPTKEGYRFEPSRKTYPRVLAPLRDENYRCELLVFAISGNAGVGGAGMQGLPDTPITDENGFYRVSVPYGWTGYVTPRKPGYSFEPDGRKYVKITGDIDRQDYRAEMLMVTIYDTILLDGEPVPGVMVSAEPGGYGTVTDARGTYSLQVPHGWSGRLLLEKPGFDFEPSGIIFSNVTSDMISGRPAPSTRGQSAARPRSVTEAYRRAVVPPTADDVLVIATRDVVPRQFAETTEDMRVMLHILREKLSEPRMILGVLYDYGDFFGRGNRDARALYLQGYGALFLLQVDFPFSFPPEPPAGGQEQTPAVDPIWERARQNLYSPRNPASYGLRARPGETPELDFNQFKEDLLQTLRHAANIRNVDPNEWVILTVTARTESSGWPAPTGAGGSYGSGMMGGMGGYGGGMWFEGSSSSTSSSSFGPGGGSTQADSATRSSGSTAGRGGPRSVPATTAPAASATVLTIQARKADIDAFGQGDLGFEQFQQRVRIFTY